MWWVQTLSSGATTIVSGSRKGMIFCLGVFGVPTEPPVICSSRLRWPRMLARRSECGECGLCACQACVRARTALWRMKWPSARNKQATTSMPMAIAMNVTT